MNKTRVILGLALMGFASGSIARPLTAAQEAGIKPDGAPINCISLAQLYETRVRDDQTIDFFTRSGKVYRNHLPYSCPQLGWEEKFAHATSLTEICSTDIITVLNDSIGRGASCGLGQFQPVSGMPR
jgi:hypothetical protein